ncbi:MAG: flagellar assembly protein FliW [Firmicutes bacterium]|nr:flagellar assembly protein FliW [Bacillota bacterium]
MPLDINTKFFGPVPYSTEEVLHFPKGIFGFEEEREFLLIPFDGEDSALLCLQSITTPALAFLVMNPFTLDPNYAPILQPEELRSMKVGSSHDLCYYVLCVVKDPISESTINLKCPVVINEDTREAMQVILDTPEFHMRHLLSEFASREADAIC